MRKIIALTITILSVGVLYGQGTEKSDYSVYSAVIRSAITDTTKSVTILNKTTKEDFVKNWYIDTTDWRTIRANWNFAFHTPFDTVAYRMTVEFFKGKNRKTKLTDNFTVPLSRYLISSKKFSSYFKTAKHEDPFTVGWQRFYDDFPGSGGLFEFSDVFYSPDKKKALVCFAVRRGGLNGRGALLILEKIKEEWKITQDLNLWHN